MPSISTVSSTGTREPALRRKSAKDVGRAVFAPPPADALPPILLRVATLLHRRWSVPVLAELQRGDTVPGGAKFITLVNRLNVSRDSLKQTLDHLIAHDYILRNPGVGHPMRPEYILAEDGYAIAPACQQLLKILIRKNIVDIALRKWSLPVILAVGCGATRFGELRTLLPQITARALTLALKDLAEARLIVRHITDGFPPGSAYRLAPAARTLLKPLRTIAGDGPSDPKSDR